MMKIDWRDWSCLLEQYDVQDGSDHLSTWLLGVEDPLTLTCPLLLHTATSSSRGSRDHGWERGFIYLTLGWFGLV